MCPRYFDIIRAHVFGNRNIVGNEMIYQVQPESIQQFCINRFVIMDTDNDLSAARKTRNESSIKEFKVKMDDAASTVT
jgi:hypothetical protein